MSILVVSIDSSSRSIGVVGTGLPCRTPVYVIKLWLTRMVRVFMLPTQRRVGFFVRLGSLEWKLSGHLVQRFAWEARTLNLIAESTYVQLRTCTLRNSVQSALK